MQRLKFCKNDYGLIYWMSSPFYSKTVPNTTHSKTKWGKKVYSSLSRNLENNPIIPNGTFWIWGTDVVWVWSHRAGRPGRYVCQIQILSSQGQRGSRWYNIGWYQNIKLPVFSFTKKLTETQEKSELFSPRGVLASYKQVSSDLQTDTCSTSS